MREETERPELPDPAVDAQPVERTRVFPCEGCGADLTFDIDAQSLKCPFCGHVKSLAAGEAAIEEQDLETALVREAERRSVAQGSVTDVHEVTCGDCGATVRFVGTLTSTECAYCGTPVQLAGVHDAEVRIPVDGVLPFQVTHDSAGENLTAWVRSRWFAPNDFRDAVKGRFQGVYMPYWTFDALTTNDYRGERGEHYWVTVRRGDSTQRVRKTRWYPASGSFRRFFDDVVVVAGSGLPSKVVRSLEPWPLNRLRPFDAALVAGFVARTYDVELADGLRDAKEIMADAIHAEVRRRIGGDEQRVHHIGTGYAAVTYKHLLLPVWMLSYRYGERVYRVLVNAATGEVQGERPWSWIKITLTVAATLAVAAGLWWALGS
jgi:DNA-directed RNA polymerase subunit RPC12/RpoP